MITLLFTLLLLVVLWFALRTVFTSASHPPRVLLLIDLVFLVIAVFIVLRWAGLLI
jgi:hypothetical protein